MPGGWEGSDRRDRLPRWWPVTVRRIIARDPFCQCAGCARCNNLAGDGPNRCTRPSQEADHITPGDDHRDLNLAGKCRPCHAKKSSQEGAEAKAAKKKPTGIFQEKHPGDLW